MDKSLLIRFMPFGLFGLFGLVSLVGLVGFTGLFGFAASALAQSNIIYQWTDENNIPHFSQLKPSHNNFTEITLASITKQSKHVNNSQKEKEVFEKSIEVINQQDNESAIEAAMVKHCEEAKANIRTLIAFELVQYIDVEGKAKVLTKSEKEQKLALSEKQVAVYCKK